MTSRFRLDYPNSPGAKHFPREKEHSNDDRVVKGELERRNPGFLALSAAPYWEFLLSELVELPVRASGMLEGRFFRRARAASAENGGLDVPVVTPSDSKGPRTTGRLHTSTGSFTLEQTFHPLRPACRTSLTFRLLFLRENYGSLFVSPFLQPFQEVNVDLFISISRRGGGLDGITVASRRLRSFPSPPLVCTRKNSLFFCWRTNECIFNSNTYLFIIQINIYINYIYIDEVSASQTTYFTGSVRFASYRLLLYIFD